MLRKQIGHLITVSLKFFFDLDPAFSSHALLICLLLAGFFKIFMLQAATAVQDGLLTVKEDSQEITSQLLALRNQWETSPFREVLLNNVRLLKNNFSEMDIRGWRVK